LKVAVHLYSNLQRFTGGNTIVEVNGDYVGECLLQLVQKYPEMQPIIWDKNGQLSTYLYVSINLESAKSETLERPVAEGDRIYLILIVAGG
jgi:molybdopterin converting factor small subunit